MVNMAGCRFARRAFQLEGRPPRVPGFWVDFTQLFAEAAATQAQAASEQLQQEIERLKTEAAEAQWETFKRDAWGTASPCQVPTLKAQLTDVEARTS